MNNFLIEINSQIFQTIKLAKVYFKNIEFSTIFLSIAFLYILFMRKWRLKKTASFLLLCGLMFILFVRLQALLMTLTVQGEDNFLLGLGQTLFFITLGFIFLYYAVKEE